MNKWHKRFLPLCTQIAGWSPDPSSKFGCIIVGPDNQVRATGFNGAPRHVQERHTRPQKYLYTEHAERNAIYNAARDGIRLEDSTLYVNGLPCADCTRAIIQSGIIGIVCTPGTRDYLERWEEIIRASITMIKEANLRLLVLDEASVTKGIIVSCDPFVQILTEG